MATYRRFVQPLGALIAAVLSVPSSTAEEGSLPERVFSSFVTAMNRHDVDAQMNVDGSGRRRLTYWTANPD